MAGQDKSSTQVIRKRARCEDPDFIYAALGALTLCVAALYMAVALPRLAPVLAPKLLGSEQIGLAAWAPMPGAEDGVEVATIAPAAGGLEKPTKVMRVTSAEKLADLFAGMGYTLDSSNNQVEVPRVFLASLPSDFKSVSSIDDRKELFIRTMLPLVLKVNESILLDRGRLLTLRSRAAAGRAPTAEEAAWLNDLAGELRLVAPVETGGKILYRDVSGS